MEFNKKKLMEDDYLKVLKFIASDVFQSRIMQALLWINLIIHSCVTMVTVYCFLYVMDHREFVNYAPVFFGTFYVILTTLTILFKGKIVANIKAEIPMWTIDSAGEKVHSRIRSEIKMITAFTVANLFFIFYSCYCFTLPVFADKDIFFAFRFCEDFFPDHKNILSWIYRSTYPLTCYVMIVPSYQLIYYTQHIKFQLMLLLEHVAAVTAFKEERNLEELFYDEDYQKQIHEKIKFCVKRHTDFIAIHKNKLPEMSNLIVAFSLCGCLLLIGIALFLSSGKIISENYTRIGTATVIACVNFVILILCGESIENQNEVAFLTILDKVCWYTFNESNKKTYLFIVQNTLRPLKIKFSENYSVNLELGLAIVNGMYSIMSVMVNMHFE